MAPKNRRLKEVISEILTLVLEASEVSEEEGEDPDPVEIEEHEEKKKRFKLIRGGRRED